MPRDVSELSPEDLQQVQNALRALITELGSRKAVGGGTGSIPDEDIVLQSLAHPERGDVLISIIREQNGRLQIFLSNRRDQDNPFAVMNQAMLRDYPGRRPLSGRGQLKEGEYALFLITAQDRDLLRVNKAETIEGYSARFELHSNPAFAPKQADDLKIKPLAQCTLDEKWQIFKKAWPGDDRPALIEQELLSFPVTYARYKQAQKSEMLGLPPEKFKERIGQLIRDVYPGGIRMSLRRDFPDEHRQRLQQVRTLLSGLAQTIAGKVFPQNPKDLNRHLDEVVDYLKDIVENDPELSHFT